LNEINLPLQLNYWQLVEVVLLLIGLTHIFFDKKTGFDPRGRDESSYRLPSLAKTTGFQGLSHPLTPVS
jgi:hypothetical protein